jgi:hypothetical protein
MMQKIKKKEPDHLMTITIIVVMALIINFLKGI